MADIMLGDLPAGAVITVTLFVGIFAGFFCGWCCRRDVVRYNAQKAAAERAQRLTRVISIPEIVG